MSTANQKQEMTIISSYHRGRAPGVRSVLSRGSIMMTVPHAGPVAVPHAPVRSDGGCPLPGRDTGGLLMPLTSASPYSAGTGVGA